MMSLNSVLIEGIVSNLKTISTLRIPRKEVEIGDPIESFEMEFEIRNPNLKSLPLKVGSYVRIVGYLNPTGIVAEHIEMLQRKQSLSNAEGDLNGTRN
jgi:hypothetical protein